MAKFRITLGMIALGAALVGLGAVAARYSREIQLARERIKSLGSQVIQTDCGLIEYARVGEGYPVLAVHGDMGGFDQGLMVAKPVIEAGYQVISISRFGYLGTPMPKDATINRQVDAYVCLLDALGIDRAAVFAFSAGAVSSIRFAARYPERLSALVLVGPAAPGKVRVASPPREIFDTMMRSEFVFWAFLTYFKPVAQELIGVPKGFQLTPQFEAELYEALDKSLPVSGRIDGFLFDTYDPQLQDEFYASITEASPYPLGKIETPVLVIVAEDDPYSNIENVRALVKKFPNARLFALPDGGHPQLGHAEEVKTAITQFMRSTLAVKSTSH